VFDDLFDLAALAVGEALGGRCGRSAERERKKGGSEKTERGHCQIL